MCNSDKGPYQEYIKSLWQLNNKKLENQLKMYKTLEWTS